ncbi:MAG TPA: sugar phosphate isomerase/epimerase family protein [Candidatus Absconditabacterales bacterium]|nr:sugar phosphate isomerase/epimerase family protein [Candidatus Absconditabacterales bacterium]
MKQIILCDNLNIEAVSPKAKNNGFGIEVQLFSKPTKCEDEAQINFHKEKIKGINPISLHAPFGDLCPGSSDPMVREVARNRFELGYKTANQLGAKSIIHHIGRVPKAGTAQKRAEHCVDFWKDFLKGKSENINFYIENLFDHNPEVLSLVIDGINKNNVKVCLDIGHAHCYSKIPVLDWIKILKDKIGYVHIHDNNGAEDEHLGIGKGNIPMFEVFSALNKYAPNAIRALECCIDHMDESITWLKNNDFL